MHLGFIMLVLGSMCHFKRRTDKKQGTVGHCAVLDLLASAAQARLVGSLRLSICRSTDFDADSSARPEAAMKYQLTIHIMKSVNLLV
jgi:hypothetical protein